MDSQKIWQMFMQTGSPELYVLYKQARKMEGSHAFDDPGAGAAGYSLQ